MSERSVAETAATTYLHGFDRREQQRLLAQADFLRPYVYPGIDYRGRRHLLELGCGVGAQTKILCKMFPRLKVTGVDLNERQLQLARRHLKNELRCGQVELVLSDAQSLDFGGQKFDSAFLCWLLEHVPEPLTVLKQVRAHLQKGARIDCTEVFNSTLYFSPQAPTLMKYWQQLNEFQIGTGGHPDVGPSLANLLRSAGFNHVHAELRPFHFDARQARTRSAFIDYFFGIFLSAEKNLREAGRVTSAQVRKMRAEVEQVKKARDAVFFYAFVRASAIR